MEGDGRCDRAGLAKSSHRDLDGAGGGGEDRRGLPQARHLGRPFYKWKAKYGALMSGGQAAEAARGENANLKKLSAEAMLDNAMLKGIAAKKW